MKRKVGLLVTLAVAVLFVLTGCGSKSTSSSSTNVSGKITAVGSTALQPLVEQASTQFTSDNPKTNITVQGGGSGTGLSQVSSGSVQIGNSDIFASQASGVDANKLVDNKVAVVGITPVVNPDTGVKNLTSDQLKQIFTGQITNWNQVGGKDEKITVVNRATGSGTRVTFEQNVLQGATAVKAQEQDSNGTVQKIVSSTPGSISYLAFSYVNSKIKAVSIDNVKPTDADVENNKWKIWAYEHMYTQKNPSKATTSFIKYVKSSAVQKKLVPKLGYISISNMKVQKDANNNVTNK